VTPAVPRWIHLLTALIAAALGVGAALAYAVSAAPAARADVSAPTTQQAGRTLHQAARPAAPPTRPPNPIPTFPVPQPSRTAGPVPTAPAPVPVPVPVPTDPVPVDPVPTDVSGSAAQTGLFDPLNGKVHGATIFSYDFMGDDGSAWNVSAKASYAVGNWAWQGSTLVVGFAEWLMDWTLQFKLADAVVGPVNRVNVGGGAARALPAGQLAGTVDPRAIAARVQTSGASAVRAGAAIGHGTTRTGEAAFTAGAAVGRLASGRPGKPAGPGAAPGSTAAAGSVGVARPGAVRTAGSWSKPRPASQLGASVGVSREEIRGDRRKAAASQLASLAVNVGAMAATGGASTAVQAGAAAARAERVRRLVSATRAAEAARAYASRSSVRPSDTATTRGRATPPTAQQARPAPEPQAPGSGTGTARGGESGRRRTAPQWVRVATAPALWVAGRPALPADPARAVKQPTPSQGDSPSPPSPSSRSATPDRTAGRAQPAGSATQVASALRAPGRHAPAGPPVSPPAVLGDEGDDGVERPAPDSGTPEGGADPDSAGTAPGTSASRVRARLRRR